MCPKVFLSFCLIIIYYMFPHRPSYTAIATYHERYNAVSLSSHFSEQQAPSLSSSIDLITVLILASAMHTARASIVPPHDITEEKDYDPIYHTGLNMGSRIKMTATDNRNRRDIGVIHGVTPKQFRVWFVKAEISTTLGKESFRVVGHTRRIPKRLPVYPVEERYIPTKETNDYEDPEEEYENCGPNYPPEYTKPYETRSAYPEPDNVQSESPQADDSCYTSKASSDAYGKAAEDSDVRALINGLAAVLSKYNVSLDDTSFYHHVCDQVRNTGVSRGKGKKEG